MKKYLIGLFAVLLTVVFYAFTPPEVEKKPTSQFWYEYIDIPGNSPSNPMHYQRTAGSGSVEPSCEPGSKRCAVLADPASGTDLEHPNLEAVSITKSKQ